MKKEIQIEIGDSAGTAKGFIDAWKRAKSVKKVKTEERLVFAAGLRKLGNPNSDTYLCNVGAIENIAYKWTDEHTRPCE